MSRIRSTAGVLTPTVLVLLILAATSLGLFAIPLASAQQASDKPATTATPAAPVPQQIVSGKKVFIANHQSDFNTGFSGGPDRAYTTLYAAMKQWGHYEIVSSPAEADLVFEMRLMDVPPRQNYVRLRLKIIDPKTNVALWTLYQIVDPAFLGANRDKNFDQSTQAVVNQVAKLAGTAPAFPPPKGDSDDSGN
jgi:hypothetical protein